MLTFHEYEYDPDHKPWTDEEWDQAKYHLYDAGQVMADAGISMAQIAAYLKHYNEQQDTLPFFRWANRLCNGTQRILNAFNRGKDPISKEK